jgi:N-methylhydantoinase A
VSVLEAALGVYRIGVATMVRVVKAVSSERGRDPRQFALVAFGGNGPVHAALVAAELGMPRVVIPPRPGLFSALGLLVAETSQHFARTVLRATTALDAAGLEETFRGLEGLANETLHQEGYAMERIALVRTADLRYVGQSFELRLPLESTTLTTAAIRDLETRFGREHEHTYGHKADNDPIEIVNLRVTATVSTAEPRERARAGSNTFGRSPAAAPPRQRLAYFGTEYGLVETAVLERSAVGASPIPGPVIVEEYDATTVVPPGSRIWRDRWDNLILDVGGMT